MHMEEAEGRKEREKWMQLHYNLKRLKNNKNLSSAKEVRICKYT